jgi:SH3-like domain-containing protein
MRLALWFGVALAALVTPALALDFRSVSDNAILYDAPSTKGVKHFIIARSTPVEIVFTQEGWTKIRDSAGNMAWVEARLLSPARTLLVRVDNADVRAAAEDKSGVVFSAEKNVVLDLIEAKPNEAHAGWVKVKPKDAQSSGQIGFIKANDVWGL